MGESIEKGCKGLYERTGKRRDEKEEERKGDGLGRNVEEKAVEGEANMTGGQEQEVATWGLDWGDRCGGHGA